MLARMNRILICAVLVGCARRSDPAWVAAQSKQTGDPTATGAPAKVGKLAGAITIDGKLDEPAWSSATALGPFVDPGSGSETSSPVEGYARVAWDDAPVTVSADDLVALFAD